MASLTKPYVITFVPAVSSRPATPAQMHCPEPPPGFHYVLVDGHAALVSLPGLPDYPPGYIPGGGTYTCYTILPYQVFNSSGVMIASGTATGYGTLPTPPPGGWVSADLGLVTVCTGG